jgi:hypothetical protein
MQAGPQMGQRRIPLGIDKIGVQPFLHEGFASQLEAQTVARMVGGTAQEQRHVVR